MPDSDMYVENFSGTTMGHWLQVQVHRFQVFRPIGETSVPVRTVLHVYKVGPHSYKLVYKPS